MTGSYKCVDFFMEFFESEGEVAEARSVCGCERPAPPHEDKTIGERERGGRCEHRHRYGNRGIT